jgi:2-desacetyl-2-hydroxyethyl bacteriochlorophyllide A dehydrogenase
MSIRCCIVTGKGQVSVVAEELPALVPPGHVRIRTQFSLISPGTELAMYNGTHIALGDPAVPFAKYPFRPGYAAVGEIVEPADTESGFNPGERVFFAGGHASEAIVPLDSPHLQRLPAGLDTRIAPFARLAQIAYAALFVAGDVKGKDVVVMGLGLVGNPAAQLFGRAGARVFGFDTLPARCAWARQCGIEDAHVVDRDAVASVQGALGDHRPALVVEATGIAALVPTCLRIVAERGSVVLLGSPRQTVEIDVYRLIHRTGACLIGAHELVIPNATAEGSLDKREVTRMMLRALRDGEINVRPLISRFAAPEQIADCYHALDAKKDEVIGVLFDWNGTRS